MKKLIYLSVALMMLIPSCNQNKSAKMEVPIVDLPGSTEKVDSIKDYISEVKVVKLISDSSALVAPSKLLLSGDKIVALSGGRVESFDKSGKYMGPIGRVGKGPGEYLHISDICIDKTEKELLCLNHQNEVLRYSLADGKYIGVIKTPIVGMTATAVLPGEDGGLYLFVANPAQADMTNFSKDFNCLKRFNSKGKLEEEQLPREDYNISLGLFPATVQSAGNKYVLSYRSGDGECYEASSGKVTPYVDLSFGKEGIAPKTMVKEGTDPMEMIGDVFMADYYKCPSCVCEASGQMYCAAFGKDSAVWNFVVDKEGGKGIRWQSFGEAAAPMTALASDGHYFYFVYSETGLKSPSQTNDALKKYLISKENLILGENDNPVIVKVKFKLQ